MFRKEENKRPWTSIYTLKPILFCPLRLKKPKHFPLPHLTSVPEDLSEQRTKLYSPPSMELCGCSVVEGRKEGKPACDRDRFRPKFPKKSSYPGQDSEHLIL